MKQIYLSIICLCLLSFMACEDPLNGPTEIVLSSQLQTCDQKIEDETLASCVFDNPDDNLSVWTWNLKFFPQFPSTSQSVLELIEYHQPDIIAFQEIANQIEFDKMVEAMELYNGEVINLSGRLNLAYMYNTCRVTSLSDPKAVLNGQVTPRPPAEWRISFQGEEIVLLNVHLKCCDDGVDQRTAAAITLKNYMNYELTEDKVIILGDFNDEVNDTSMQTFLQDSDHFRFADEHISFSDESFWSYPSFPSDIDHILINDQLFKALDTATTVLLDDCFLNYDDFISDHRPVAAYFKF